MRNLLMLMLCGCGFGAASLGAGVIQFQVTPLAGAGQYRYNYTLSGITFQANQDLDIQFPASSYSNLTNGMAPAGFLVNLFQSNNPPGVQGDYVALATVNNPSTVGPFSVDFKYLGTGLPGAQAYTIDQFDATGNFIGTIASGTTVPVSTSGVPEPGSISLALIGLAGGAGCTLRRRGKPGVTSY